MLKLRQQPGTTAGGSALDRTLRYAKYRSRVGDGVAEHVYQDQSGLLIGD
jgi:hypothetical protein